MDFSMVLGPESALICQLSIFILFSIYRTNISSILPCSLLQGALQVNTSPPSFHAINRLRRFSWMIVTLIKLWKASQFKLGRKREEIMFLSLQLHCVVELHLLSALGIHI